MSRLKVTILILTLFLSGCLFGSNKTPNSDYLKVSGYVLNYANEPIVEATVYLTDYSGTKVNLVHKTDNQGYFEFSVLKNTFPLWLEISHDEYWSHHEILSLSTARTELSISILAKNETIVSGRVDYALVDFGISSIRSTSIEELIVIERPKEILVRTRLKSGSELENLMIELDALEYTINEYLELIKFRVKEDDDIDHLYQRARNHPAIEEVYINEYYFSLANLSNQTTLATNHTQRTQHRIEPNDQFFDKQWNLEAIYLPEAWSITNDSPNISIAVIDTGVDINHPDLQANIDKQNAYNVIAKNNKVVDTSKNSHGTHVAGIIGATTNNRIGIAGATWDVNLIPIQVFSDKGNATVESLAEGIKKAIEFEVDIINISLGGTQESSYLHECIKEAHDKGIIIIAAAGNKGFIYPARYEEVIAVGATNKSHIRWYYYESGDGVKIYAPGVNIWSTFKTSEVQAYGELSGTSMAAPLVTGLAALLKANNGVSDSETLKRILWDTGIELDLDYPGTRLINAYAAITEANLDNTKLTFISEDNSRYDVEINDRFFEVVLPTGTYYIEAHLDITNSGTISPGDWVYFSTEPFGGKESKLNIRLSLRQ